MINKRKNANIKRSCKTLIAILLIGFLVLPLTVITGLTYSSSRSGKIVFASSPPPPLGEFFNSDIFVADEKGQNWVRLTNDPADDTRPTWSSDGTKIAFVSERDGNREIYVMRADGKNQTNFSNNPGPDDESAWSPDGERIAFCSDRDGNYEIYIMDADGKNQKRLTDNPDPDMFPDWTSDGKIIFNRGIEVIIMNADGKNQGVLTVGAGFPDCFGPSPGQDVEVTGKLKTTWGNIKITH